ncbi:MAG: hypothetical protein H7233_07205 [Pseudorhodobacter sp.]|nr:hypothetical protein [Frankiaceae bacterium]
MATTGNQPSPENGPAAAFDDSSQAGSSSNVRLVVVDSRQQPRSLNRAHGLEQAILRVAAIAGVDEGDMPGLHGLCVCVRHPGW